jgi:histidinol dehydrogenase
MLTPGIGPVENHRGREGGLLIYPVYSRRSRGISVGINLFPDRKLCSFDCPYCEVFPFETEFPFSVECMEADLAAVLEETRKQGLPAADISFSGNGEPTLSPFFAGALEGAARIRERFSPDIPLTLITNGSGLLEDRTFELLRRAAGPPFDLRIWLKLDAGTPDWYARINRTQVPFDILAKRIGEFVRHAPVTIQTMLCAVEGKGPPPEEARAWEERVVELAVTGGILEVQIYGKARPAPGDPLSERLPVSLLEERAVSLRKALAARHSSIPVEVFP